MKTKFILLTVIFTALFSGCSTYTEKDSNARLAAENNSERLLALVDKNLESNNGKCVIMVSATVASDTYNVLNISEMNFSNTTYVKNEFVKAYKLKNNNSPIEKNTIKVVGCLTVNVYAGKGGVYNKFYPSFDFTSVSPQQDDIYRKWSHISLSITNKILSDINNFRQSLKNPDKVKNIDIGVVENFLRNYKEVTSDIGSEELIAAVSSDRMDVASLIYRKSQGEINSEAKNMYALNIIKNGEFDDVYILANQGNYDAIRRAYDIANTREQKMKIEEILIKTSLNKIIVMKFTAKGDGNTKAYGGTGSGALAEVLTMAFGYGVGAESNAIIDYQIKFDEKILDIKNSYKFNAKVVLTAIGSGEYESHCMWPLPTKCKNKITSEVYSKDFSGVLNKNEMTNGVISMQWKPKYQSQNMMGLNRYFVASKINFEIKDLKIELLK